jgi:hypothetical protein
MILSLNPFTQMNIFAQSFFFKAFKILSFVLGFPTLSGLDGWESFYSHSHFGLLSDEEFSKPKSLCSYMHKSCQRIQHAGLALSSVMPSPWNFRLSRYIFWHLWHWKGQFNWTFFQSMAWIFTLTLFSLLFLQRTHETCPPLTAYG